MGQNNQECPGVSRIINEFWGLALKKGVTVGFQVRERRRQKEAEYEVRYAKELLLQRYG